MYHHKLLPVYANEATQRIRTGCQEEGTPPSREGEELETLVQPPGANEQTLVEVLS